MGEEEDRKFPQLLLSTSPPSLKAEHALRSFTDRFSDKITVKKKPLLPSALSFPRTEIPAPGSRFTPCRGDTAALSPPAWSEGL